MSTPERRCSHVAFWVVIVILILLLGLSFLLNLGLAAGLASSSGSFLASKSQTAEDEFPRLQERWSYGSGDVKAVRIAVEGVIERSVSHGWLGIRRDESAEIRRQIQAARNDEKVRALIVEVDSPGGEVSPTDEIYRALRAFRESREDRRVIVLVRNLAASGGYYVAAAADRIIVEPTSLVGSISVIIQALNWHALSERVGITDTTIRSGRNKDLLNPFRPVDPEQVAMLQRLVDHLHARFARVVQEGRRMEEGAVAAVADGSVFSAADAVEKGLADEIGYWEEAVARTAELLGESSVRVVRYVRTPRLSEWLAGVSSPFDGLVLSVSRGPRVLMLWQP